MSQTACKSKPLYQHNVKVFHATMVVRNLSVFHLKQLSKDFEAANERIVTQFALDRFTPETKEGKVYVAVDWAGQWLTSYKIRHIPAQVPECQTLNADSQLGWRRADLATEGREILATSAHHQNSRTICSDVSFYIMIIMYEVYDSTMPFRSVIAVFIILVVSMNNINK